MNLVDLVIFLILTLFVLMGMHKGTVKSAFNIISYIGSFLLTFLIYMPVAKLVSLNNTIIGSMRFYAEGYERLASLESSVLVVSELSPEQITQIVTDSVNKGPTGLRAPLDTKVLNNMQNLVFEGEFSTVGEYFNETIVHYGINIICFILVFIVIKLIFNLVLNIYTGSHPIPKLVKHDILVGGILGLVEGMLILALLFSLVPLFYNVMYIEPLEELLSSSLMGNLFSNVNIIPPLIRGVI